MAANCVDLTLTDIPYAEVNKESSGLRVLDKEDANTLGFTLETFVDESVRVTRGSIYVFCGWEQVSPLLVLYGRHGLTTRIGVWVKTNPSPMNGQRVWLSGTEMCVFARKSNATFNEHCKSAVWTYPSGTSKTHPTEKPEPLFERLILASSNEGDTVFDPCSGSGTTASVCVRTGRSFVGFEMSPRFYAESCTRIDIACSVVDRAESNKTNASLFFDL